jgi:hypothetical protein
MLQLFRSLEYGLLFFYQGLKDFPAFSAKKLQMKIKSSIILSSPPFYRLRIQKFSHPLKLTLQRI